MLSKAEIKIFQVLHETRLGLLNLFMEYFHHTENNYSFLLNHNGLSFLKTCFQWKKILEISHLSNIVAKANTMIIQILITLTGLFKINLF